MVVGFRTTYTISIYHHWSYEVYSIQQYVMKFVSNLWQVVGFCLGTPVSSTNKTDHRDKIYNYIPNHMLHYYQNFLYFFYIYISKYFLLVYLKFLFQITVLIYCGRYLGLNSSIVLCCDIVLKRGTYPSKTYLKMQNQTPYIAEVMKKGQKEQISTTQESISSKWNPPKPGMTSDTPQG